MRCGLLIALTLACLVPSVGWAAEKPAAQPEVKGFVVEQLKAGSLFSLWGLRNGDIIITVNGKSCVTPEAIDDCLGLPGQKNIGLIRDGKLVHIQTPR